MRRWAFVFTSERVQVIIRTVRNNMLAGRLCLLCFFVCFPHRHCPPIHCFVYFGMMFHFLPCLASTNIYGSNIYQYNCPFVFYSPLFIRLLILLFCFFFWKIRISLLSFDRSSSVNAMSERIKLETNEARKTTDPEQNERNQYVHEIIMHRNACTHTIVFNVSHTALLFRSFLWSLHFFLYVSKIILLHPNCIQFIQCESVSNHWQPFVVGALQLQWLLLDAGYRVICARTTPFTLGTHAYGVRHTYTFPFIVRGAKQCHLIKLLLSRFIFRAKKKKISIK